MCNYESPTNQILIFLLLSVLRALNQFNFQNGGFEYIFYGFLDEKRAILVQFPINY